MTYARRASLLFIFFVGVLCALVFQIKAFAVTTPNLKLSETENPSQPLGLEPLNLDAEDISNWSQDEKLGQFIMVGFRSIEQLKQVRPGGVVLFSWSMKDVDQTKQLTSSIHEYSEKQSRAPLFVATDHEGGRVLRLRKGMTPFPDAAAIGSSSDPELAFRVGKAMGSELSALGINMNLAPVLDLGNARSFLANRVWGSEPSSVSDMTISFIRGLHAARVLAVAKHFPGHGGSADDSHYNLPVINKSEERLWNEDLVPFKRAVEDGVSAVMTAHVEIPAIAKGPASLAPEFVTKILRDRLNFQGLVLTDDLEMGGVAKQTGMAPADLALKALKAGSDMILVVWSMKLQEDILSRIKLALKNGEINQEWIDTKLKRILALKRRFVEKTTIENPYWKDNLRTPEHLTLARLVAEQGIQWNAGNSKDFIEQLAQRWNEPWVSLVPNQGWRKMWSDFRQGDQVVLCKKRADPADVSKVRRIILNSLEKRLPLIIVTPPRALGSEEIFAAIRAELGLALKQGKIKSPVIWAHQGATPVDIKWKPDSIGMGILSLHSGSAESFRAFARVLHGSEPGGRTISSETEP